MGDLTTLVSAGGAAQQGTTNPGGSSSTDGNFLTHVVEELVGGGILLDLRPKSKEEHVR